MAKKELHYLDAERMYVQEQLTFSQISEKLDVSIRTLQYWSDEGNWPERRKEIMKTAKSSHEKTYGLYNRLLDKVMKNLEDGKEASQAELYTLTKLAPLLVRIKQYEDLQAQKGEEKPRGLTPETIAAIEESILGIKK